MSKRMARRIIAREKPGATAKEFLTLCQDMGFWFDTVLDNEEALAIYYALIS